MKTTVYMVRHAESTFVFGAERARELSQQGIIDAKEVAYLFSKLDIHAIISSPYTRAVQTVQFLAESKGLQIIQYEEFRERPIKGLDYKLDEKELMNAICKSFEDKEFYLKGGESTKDAQDRAIPLFERLLEEYEGKALVIGTHGNIMTIIMNYYDNSYGYNFWLSTTKPDVYRLVFCGRRLEMVERIWRNCVVRQ